MDERRPVSSLKSGDVRRFCGVLVGCGLVSLAFLAAGCFSTGWLIMKVDGKELYMGLWTAKTCFGDKCNYLTTSEMNSVIEGLSSMAFGEYQVETCLALGLMVAALIMLPSCAVCKGLASMAFGEYQVGTCLALGLMVAALIMLPCCASCKKLGASLQRGALGVAIATLISGILAITASAKYGNKIEQEEEVTWQLEGEIFIETPYSVILTGVGGILALVMSLATLTVLKPWRRESEPQPQFVMNQEPAVYPPNYAKSQAQAVCPPTYAMSQAPGAPGVFVYPHDYAMDNAPQTAAVHKPAFPGQDPGLSSDPYRAGY